MKSIKITLKRLTMGRGIIDTDAIW